MKMEREDGQNGLNDSVYGLVTELCKKLAPKGSNNAKVKRIRSKAYEILLRRPEEIEDPVVDLLSHYFLRSASRRSLDDYRDVAALRRIVEGLVDDPPPRDAGVLACVVALAGAEPPSRRDAPLRSPFALGDLDEIVPPPPIADKNQPKPYQHLPLGIFRLVDRLDDLEDAGPYRYPIEKFTAKPGTALERLENAEIFTDRSKSSSSPLYAGTLADLQSYPRLTAPRDLSVPEEPSPTRKNVIFKTSPPDERPSVSGDVESGPPATLWELASLQVDIPTDIWEKAYLLPPVVKRPFISSSSSQMHLWKQIHRPKMSRLNILSEPQFILHLKYLAIGIPSSSFMFDSSIGKFLMKPGLCVEGLSQITLSSYISDILKTGTCYWKLNFLVSSASKSNEQDGFVYKATRDNIKQYLVWFRLEIDHVFGEGLITIENECKKLPTLTEIMHKLKPLTVQIRTMARIYGAYESENSDKSLGGAGLMACLYNEIISITNTDVSKILYATLKATCTVYFRFIQEFIFEGELNDQYDEFFIKKDDQNVESYNKRYWNKGFVIRNDEVIPEFLRGMAKYILLCGKSLRLLKLCNPSHPLCIMLSSDYPDIQCCLTFEEIERRQILYDHYRTQCLYVCGEPVTFHSLMIQKDAEKRAFREILALRQAETMEKLIEERKRLSKMLQANKRRQFAALREAAETAISRRKEEKEQNIREEKLILEHSKACDKIHQLKIEDEKKKVIAFYDEIEKEVMKRQMIADWKIKRLKLDERRVELITSEKMDLNREQWELMHQSTTFENNTLSELKDKVPVIDVASPVEKEMQIMHLDKVMENNVKHNCEDELLLNKENNNLEEINRKSQCILDSAVSEISDINKNIISNINKSSVLDRLDIVNSNVITNLAMDNLTQAKLEALRNKQKVLSHEFGSDYQLPSCSNDDQNLSLINNNLSELQKNKIKSLGSDINGEAVRGYDLNQVSQYDTEASREALKNKQKVLGHEFGLLPPSGQYNKRDNLRLDLHKCDRVKFEWNKGPSSALTPSSFADTPLELPVRLDIETPSNFEIGPFGLPSAATLSPLSGQVPEIIDKSVTRKGFSFPNVDHYEDFIDDITPDEVDNEQQFIHQEDEGLLYDVKSTVWNFVDDDLHFDNFRPFGIDSLAKNKFSMDFFTSTFTLECKKSPYSDVVDIIKDAEKTPMKDLFKMINSDEDILVTLETIEHVDLSTISTCLQRSIMIPLSCQMEMVNNAILKYFLADCDLYEHLKNIRNFFFLMDGEFAKMFCSDLFSKLNMTENPRDLLNFAMLHSILRKSFGSSITATGKYVENLSFIITDMPMSFHHSSPDILECLSLSYTVGWPLNIIMSQEAMERYAKIFQFLVKLRRISWVLEHDSEVLKMSLKEELILSRELLHSPQYHSIQLYRYIMSSLIRALHSYILTTCLQSSWSEFEKDLAEAQTLDNIYSVHVIYIKKVLFRCLLNNRSASIMKILNDIFCVILRFHHLLNARCWHVAENEIHYTHPLFGQMRELFNNFEKLAKHFHKMVTRLTDCGYQPHLSELLSVINMNDYYKPAYKK